MQSRGSFAHTQTRCNSVCRGAPKAGTEQEAKRAEAFLRLMSTYGLMRAADERWRGEGAPLLALQKPQVIGAQSCGWHSGSCPPLGAPAYTCLSVRPAEHRQPPHAVQQVCSKDATDPSIQKSFLSSHLQRAFPHCVCWKRGVSALPSLGSSAGNRLPRE